MSHITAALSARFDTADHKQKPQGGQKLTYVPADKYIERVNSVFGEGWGWEIVSQHLDHVARYAVVHGRLTYTDHDGHARSKDGVGVGQDMTNGQKEELDKILKTANSEAVKNAAKLLGVGLYLYDGDERAEVEHEMRNPRPKQAPKPPAQKSEHANAASALFATAGEILKPHGITAKEAQTGILRQWLTSKGRPASSGDITTDGLQALAQILRDDPAGLLAFAGSNSTAPQKNGAAA